jgi:hypothetical protein
VRDYGRVYSAFWQSPEIRSLPEDARTLALYLLTTPHGNLIGCFRLPDAYAADDLQWTAERVSEGFAKLVEVAFVRRDEATKWVFIAKYLKWNPFENPNVAKAAWKAFDQVPDISLKSALALAILESGAHLSEAFAKACGTLTKDYRKPEPEPEPEPEPKPEPEKKEARKRAAPAPEDVEPQVWLDWVALRKGKRANVSQTAIEEARKEAAKAGISFNAFLRIWCRRGSQGLEASWLKADEISAGRRDQSFTERSTAVKSARLAEMTGGLLGAPQRPSNVIDMEEGNAPLRIA